MKYIFIITTWFLLTGASCKKSTTQEDQLPPITQTGANTFGCLVNGKVYIPKGYSGTGSPNFRCIYEIISGRPYFYIKTTQYEEDIPIGSIYIYINDFTSAKTFFYQDPDMALNFGWNKYFPNCGAIINDLSIYRSGSVTIHKYDPTNGIFSGTFNFKIKNNTCDTIRITEGRFDYKL